MRQRHQNRHLLVGVAFLLAALSVDLRIGWAQGGQIEVGGAVEVNTGGESLNLRQRPGLDALIVARLPDSTVMTVVGGPVFQDGYEWWELQGDAGSGWAAGAFLRPTGNQESLDATSSAGRDEELRCEQSESVYPGVVHCIRDTQKSHLILIDLDDPHVRFETALARDVQNVNSSALELVEEMVGRYLDRGRGVVAAVNGDYFGAGHVTEGLTVQNGERLDGVKRGDGDLGAVYRSALVIGETPMDVAGASLPIHVGITRLERDDENLDEGIFFNAIGGGPQVVFGGTWDWARGLPHDRYKGCPSGGDVINGECFIGTDGWDKDGKRWTAIGVTGDGQMVWFVGPYEHVGATFAEFEVQEAIKLDGGGSSQLWYQGGTVVKSSDSRRVGSALMVFYVRSAKVVEVPRWPVVVEGEALTIRLTVQNTGAETWGVGKYVLLNERNSWGLAEAQHISQDVQPGETVTWEWTTQPFAGWGIKTSQWRMSGEGIPFPEDPVRISVVVVPAELTRQKEELQRKIEEWLAAKVDNIEERILEWLTTQTAKLGRDFWQWLRETLCGVSTALMSVGLVGVALRGRLRRIRKG